MIKKLMIMTASIVMLSMGATAAQAQGFTHRIVNGESLYKIAVNNGVTVEQLKQANGIQGTVIYAGDKLAVPTASKQANDRVSNRDLELLARLITAEAEGEPYEGQVAVAAVILNRMNDLKFPGTIAQNIFKPNEFESVSNGQIWKQPVSDAYRAAQAALNGWDPTNGAKYFFNPAKVTGGSWVWTRTITHHIGNHVFGI